MNDTLNSPAYSESVDGATLREYAAIKLRVPDSGNDELDAMIRESRRLDYAGQALSWPCFGESGFPEKIAQTCLEHADAMLAAMHWLGAEGAK